MVFEFHISVVHLCSGFIHCFFCYFNSKGTTIAAIDTLIEMIVHTKDVLEDFFADLALLLVSSKSCSMLRVDILVERG